MDPISAFFIYKISCLGIGAFIVLLGYRLLSTGIFPPSDDTGTLFEKNYVLFKRSAPGAFMLLGGGAILFFSITIESSFFHNPKLARGRTKTEKQNAREQKASAVPTTNSLNRDQELRTAQAINTIIKASPADLQDESYLNAKRFLQDERLRIAKLRLSPSDFDAYLKHADKDFCEVPQECCAAVERAREWMEKKLEP